MTASEIVPAHELVELKLQLAADPFRLALSDGRVGSLMAACLAAAAALPALCCATQYKANEAGTHTTDVNGFNRNRDPDAGAQMGEE